MIKWFKRRLRKPIPKFLRPPLFFLFNLFYYPLVFAYFKKRLSHLPDKTQLFLVTRTDFGAALMLLQYIRCWQHTRGPTAIVILSRHWSSVQKIAKIVTPNSTVIAYDGPLAKAAVACFGDVRIHYHTLHRIYVNLANLKPNALFIFDQAMPGILPDTNCRFVEHLDPLLKKPPTTLPPSFLNAYILNREVLDCRRDTLEDLFKLSLETSQTLPSLKDPASFGPLAKNLNIRQPFILLSINCKKYGEHSPSTRRRTIHTPMRYEPLIDRLIEKGYDVVLHGRREQPLFTPRQGLIDYAHSSHCSVENDLLLFSEASAAMFSKTGAELFAAICNTPTLGLNYTELTSLQPNPKLRFYPKKLLHKELNTYLSWKEVLQSPCFFDIGLKYFQEELVYQDMESEELLDAAEEFLALISQDNPNWMAYTPLQKAFRQELTPLHLDLYHTPIVPCECYLQKYPAATQTRVHEELELCR